MRLGLNLAYSGPSAKDNVELVPRAVAAVTPTGLVDTEGAERTVDVIVMATGFQPTNYLARVRVVGCGGRVELRQRTRDDALADQLVAPSRDRGERPGQPHSGGVGH